MAGTPKHNGKGSKANSGKGCKTPKRTYKGRKTRRK